MSICFLTLSFSKDNKTIQNDSYLTLTSQSGIISLKKEVYNPVQAQIIKFKGLPI